MEGKIKLYYFDVYARAEAIRMLLNHAKVDFDNVYLDKDAFEKLRDDGKLEFGQVPLVEVGGKLYVQSVSILNYLGRKFGYYPEDIE